MFLIVWKINGKNGYKGFLSSDVFYLNNTVCKKNMIFAKTQNNNEHIQEDSSFDCWFFNRKNKSDTMKDPSLNFFRKR